MDNKVSTEKYDQRVRELDTLCDQIIAAKRPVYTGDNADVVRNFRVQAIIQGTTPGQVLSTYLLKQIMSIVQLLSNPDIKDEEKATRFADARNYIDLGYVLYSEGLAHERQ